MAPSTTDPEELVAAAQAGDRSALARLISWVEQGGERARSVGRVTFRHGGGAYTVGITGAPGSGKSTLTSALVGRIRAAGDEVGVLAIDPSSPFTGGALLGDRVRMGDHVLDDGVFIRSMATRGHLGGLALATMEAVRVLDAAGKPWILVETVGVGQVEVEVAGAADTTIVVVNPGWGDAVQANKAGLLEIADIFVINKADRPGADQTRRDLEQMLELSASNSRDWADSSDSSDPAGPGDSSGSGDSSGARDSSAAGAPGWRPPILLTVAIQGDGVDELWATVGAHQRHLQASGRLATRRADRLADELRHIMAARLLERAHAATDNPDFERIRDDVSARRLDPWSAADQLLGLDG
jgi:LAO/AO transport system kinase